MSELSNPKACDGLTKFCRRDEETQGNAGKWQLPGREAGGGAVKPCRLPFNERGEKKGRGTSESNTKTRAASQ